MQEKEIALQEKESHIAELEGDAKVQCQSELVKAAERTLELAKAQCEGGADEKGGGGRGASDASDAKHDEKAGGDAKPSADDKPHPQDPGKRCNVRSNPCVGTHPTDPNYWRPQCQRGKCTWGVKMGFTGGVHHG